jgi:hypothetical protein
MDLLDRLIRAKAGGAILFCGAGFSADCLNFNFDEELGVSNSLCTMLNDEISGETNTKLKKVTNAAQKFRELRGQKGLLDFLTKKYNVSTVTQDMIDVLKFPWDRVYTTNYDNAIELSLSRSRIRHTTINNHDIPDDISTGGVEIVHLHGSAIKWNMKNFDKSCVLTTESYINPKDVIGPWLNRLQIDFEKSEVFIFVGFSAGDFHLNQVFFNATDSRNKVYFVNRSTSTPDADLVIEQGIHGSPIFIGNSGLSELLDKALDFTNEEEPYCPSFRRYERVSGATEIPSVEEIKDLLIFGKLNHEQIVRDSTLVRSEYSIRRTKVEEIVNSIEDGGSPILITGEICDGKSIIIEQLAARLSLTRPVYMLDRQYDSVIEEASTLAARHPSAVIIVESCFELRAGRLDTLIQNLRGTEATLLLTTRSISARAEVSEFELMKANKDLVQYRIGELDDAEVQQLIKLTDQIGEWSDFPSTAPERERFIREFCHRSLPSFMLKLLRSGYVLDRYSEEYQKVVSLSSPRHIRLLTGALYLSHIGHESTSSFMSNLFKVDSGKAVDDLNETSLRFRLLRIEHGVVKTVPSIGASTILRDVIPLSNKKIVVDTVVEMLRALAGVYRDDHMKFIFKQLMRYSIVSTVVSDRSEINRFFDNVSSIDPCRSMVLFWIQWHMAMVDQSRWEEAKLYLDRSYIEAENYERRNSRKFDRFQVDDRKSKFLMIKNRSEPYSLRMFADFKESCLIIGRLMRRIDVSHHPFNTFIEVLSFFEQHGALFPAVMQDQGRQLIDQLAALAEKRKGLLDFGYPRGCADKAIEAHKAFVFGRK